MGFTFKLLKRWSCSSDNRTYRNAVMRVYSGLTPFIEPCDGCWLLAVVVDNLDLYKLEFFTKAWEVCTDVSMFMSSLTQININ